MRDKVIPFHSLGQRELREDRRKRRIRCEVSPRWLQLSEQIDRYEDRDYMHVYVMTLDSNEKERKLCELILDPQELAKVILALPIKDWLKKE